MRLRTYSAPTVSEAMALVRREMGDDAIIVSTQSTIDGLGARVTAAIEEPAFEEASLDAALDGGWPDDEASPWTQRPTEPPERGEVEECLSYHGVPDCFIDRLTAVADLGDGAPESTMLALASLLEAADVFKPIDFMHRPGAYILVGTPGAGKTIATAKLVVDAFKRGRPIRAISTDAQRAGGIEQLQAFMRIIGCDLATAKTPRDLERAAALAGGVSVFIDTAGINPFDQGEIAMLSDLIAASKATPILVMNAGLDPYECADVAGVFAGLDIRVSIATRLDAVRRLGALLSPPLAAGIRMGASGASAKVAEPITPINPVSLARLLLSKMSRTMPRARAIEEQQ